MTGISNPHDKFYKAIFSRPEVAKDFLFQNLPPEITSLLNCDSIVLIKDSYIDHNFREQFSDLLYTAAFKSSQEVYLYLLFEHKSYPDPLVSFQLLRYMVQIWQHDLNNSKSPKLRVIIPIVFYHGEKEWTIHTNFKNFFSCPEEFQPFIPDFQYVLYDTHCFNDDEIKGEWLLRAAILSMKYIFREEFPVKMKQILRLIRDKGKECIPEILEIVVKYITCASDRISYNDLVLEIQNTFSETNEDIMPTIAEQFINQGLERGIQEGILDILETRFSYVPPAIKSRISQIDDVVFLKKLHRSAITIGSCEEFLHLIDGI